MHDLAIVSKIQKLEPIKDKDRIEMATIENYHSIVQKGQFNVGDKAIYIFYDSILPERPEFEFLRKRCWSEKYQGFRIRPMKMGGEISEGLVMPMSILSKDYKEGTIVTDELGIRLYDPEANENVSKKEDGKVLKFFMKYLWFRTLRKKLYHKRKGHAYPSIAPKSDETNIEMCYNKVKNVTETWYLSEKVEGMASMFHYITKGNILNCYSHNMQVTSGVWVDIAKTLNLKHNLKKYCKKHHLKEIAIAGEIAGPKIQKNIYGFDSFKFFLYNAYIGNKEKFNINELTELAHEIQVEMVPQLGTAHIQDFEDVEAILTHCEGNSILCDKKIPREGIVWRTSDGRISFKAKSRPYKIWFGE